MVLFRWEDDRPHLAAGFFAEMLGSFVFVFLGAAAVAVQPALPAPPDAVVIGLAHGIALVAAMWLTAPLSGGHVNPMVSLMFFVHGLVVSALERAHRRGGGKRELHQQPPMEFFGWRFALVWVLGQLAGAVVAGALLLAVFGGSVPLGRPAVGAAFSFGRAFGYEIIGTAVLLLVVLMVVVSPRLRTWAAGRIGATFLALNLVGAVISGASLNWWRHFGPTVVANAWDGAKAFPPSGDADLNDGVAGRNVDWLWYVGPLLGVVAALAVFWPLYYYAVWAKNPFSLLVTAGSGADDDAVADADITRRAAPKAANNRRRAASNAKRVQQQHAKQGVCGLDDLFD
jgi:glycerol uptake facilitator-like aquaporin